MTPTLENNPRLVAEICLYGGLRCGVGYITVTRDGRSFGNGEPRIGRSHTETLWQACGELRNAGYRGIVRVFAPGGNLMADCDLSRTPKYGDLLWQRAPVYTISAAEIMAAGETVSVRA